MANWLNKMNIYDEMALFDSGACMEAVNAIRNKFARLVFVNDDDRHLHEDALFEIDEAIDCFYGDGGYEELVDVILEVMYDFGDSLSGLNTGEECFSQRKKLLFVKPW